MKKLILIALICLFSANEGNGIDSEHFIIELPQGYEPVEIKTPYKESTPWKIRNRGLLKKYWR